MEFEKYSPNTISVSAILGNIMSKDIVIPEIQRPFVWKKTQVRDLMDSLYKGYPTGYLIIWRNTNVKLKDGSISSGKKIMIDGQQRVTALMTAILGIETINTDYKKESIKIAFNPFEALSDDKEAEIFQVQDQSHLKSKKWIPDISEVFKNEFLSLRFIKTYCENNPEMSEDNLDKALTKLKAIGNRQIGVIELSENLDIDIVTDIFIRINSRGTALSQGDFVMSKIAADEKFGGNTLRKAIDYFSHLCVKPSFYEEIKNNDLDFYNTEYMCKMSWMKDENDSVYDPDYADVIRVAFMHKFGRAKLAELVSLLSGRDFDTRDYTPGAETTYNYNLANLVTGMTNTVGGTVQSSFTYTYLLDGNQSMKTDSNNETVTYTYDGAGRLVSEAYTNLMLNIGTVTYTYDAAGNRATMTDTRETAAGTTIYTYDANNRLTSSTLNWSGTAPAGCPATLQTTFAYDANGNQLGKTDTTATHLDWYNPNTELTKAETTELERTARAWEETAQLALIIYGAAKSASARKANTAAAAEGGEYIFCKTIQWKSQSQRRFQ